jgi:NitT/TauT family transport system permease protein
VTPSTTPPDGTARTRLLHWAQALAVAAFWLVVWQVAAWVVRQNLLLVSPWQAARRLVELVPTGGFWATVWHSLARIALGFVLAVVIGCLLAWVASLHRWVGALISPLVRFIRSVPVVSFIILVLMWAGSGWLATIVSCLMVLPVVFANVEEGLRQRDRKLRELADVFGLRAGRRWLGLWLPALWPYLTAACRVGLGLAWKAGVSAEVIGLTNGSIGERLYQAKIFLSTADLFCWTAVIVLLSWGFEKLVLWLLAVGERRLERVYAK